MESWPFGVTICKVSETTRDISIGVTVFTLTALSADRFFAIVDPMRKLHASVGGRRATKFTVTVAVTIWCLAILCAAPAAAYSYIRKFQNVDNVTLLEVCYPYPEELGPNFPQLAVLVKFLIYYVVPLSAIACFYIMMARHLINSTKNMPGEVQVSTVTTARFGLSSYIERNRAFVPDPFLSRAHFVHFQKTHSIPTSPPLLSHLHG